MKVTLIDHTYGAVDKLIFTKNTRLKMSPDFIETIQDMTMEEKTRELEYMVNTIRSSWEFVSYTFMIEGVSRAFTHQFVRNRQGSYAQQTMRILDVSGFDYVTGPTILQDPGALQVYQEIMGDIQDAYDELIEMGVKIEDARGVLPTNICTNICVQYNLRTLAELVTSRSSPRTQGEFREVLDAMYYAVVDAHPWAAMFLKDQKHGACEFLQQFIDDTGVEGELCTDLIKKLDILRK